MNIEGKMEADIKPEPMEADIKPEPMEADIKAEPMEVKILKTDNVPQCSSSIEIGEVKVGNAESRRATDKDQLSPVNVEGDTSPYDIEWETTDSDDGQPREGSSVGASVPAPGSTPDRGAQGSEALQLGKRSAVQMSDKNEADPTCPPTDSSLTQKRTKSEEKRKHVRVTFNQLKVMWKCLKRNREIAKGKDKSEQGRRNSRRMWRSLAERLNAEDGPDKDWKGWAKYWSDYKASLRTKKALIDASKTKDNEEGPDLPGFNAVQLRFISLLGKSFGRTPVDRARDHASGRPGDVAPPPRGGGGPSSLYHRYNLRSHPLPHSTMPTTGEQREHVFLQLIWEVRQIKSLLRESISNRPASHQLEALADFLDKNPGIAKGVLRSARGKHETKMKWEEAAHSINALGRAQKDGRGWAKYWADKKCSLKKTCAHHASMRRTDGGPADDMPYFTPIDQRLVEVMGGPQIAAGDSTVALNSFSFTNLQSQPIKIQEMAHVVKESPAVFTSPAQDEEAVRETPSPEPLLRQRSPVRTHSTDRKHTRAARSVLDRDRARFAAIEAQRVEAEAATARALSQAVERVGDLAAATVGLAAAVRETGQTIAGALDRIASALQRN